MVLKSFAKDESGKERDGERVEWDGRRERERRELAVVSEKRRLWYGVLQIYVLGTLWKWLWIGRSWY
jgi:hypothetical protein